MSNIQRKNTLEKQGRVDPMQWRKGGEDTRATCGRSIQLWDTLQIYSREDGVRSPGHRGRDPDRRRPNLDNQRAPTPERVEGRRTCKNNLYKNTKQHKQPENRKNQKGPSERDSETDRPRSVIGGSRITPKGHQRKEHRPAPACLSGWGAQRLKHQNLGSSKASDQNKRSAREGSRSKREGREKEGEREKRLSIIEDFNTLSKTT
ncbi:hypothetical protein SLEP1_g26491 [Rubroshorea leprosula]|uniref:Uncharacterized protein n=1 Tax=Rubroshorea leprosula TaxID=152421 RepID=A0AAV5JQ32_9ROSI|nr:hypothetical protein SLEP1_g26491 [Rubroshorea leprosula]